MHRTIEITVPPSSTDELSRELNGLEHVMGLSVHRGASVKPPGDVLIVHALNRGVDDVLKLAQAARKRGAVSIVTAELASIIDPQHEEAVDKDVDEAVWEEMETGLRHQGRVTANYLALMALGGGVATVGLVSEPAPQAIAFVAAAVIAPGFEPIAKIPLGLVLRRWNVVWRGFASFGAGYAVLILAAAVTFLALTLTGYATIAELLANPEVEHISHPQLKELLVSGCGAAAGAVMITAYRRSVIAGPLIALVLIHAAALMGAGLAAREAKLIYEGLERLALDMLLIVVLGAIVFAIKQAFVHRRSPIV